MKNFIKPKIDTLDYGYTVLPNGLKVLLISDPETKTSSATLGVNIGSLVEKKDEEGLAHFCEHLLFMGNKKYPSENEYGDYISKNGGEYNAFTSQDRTVYYFDISNEAFEGALDIFAQFFICPIFNEGSVEREIKAIDNEFTNKLNDDSKRAKQLKCSEMNKESPFNHFGTGNLQTLSQPNIRDKLLNFYKQFYTSEIMNLCIYNNKTLDELLKIVENLFSLVPKIEGFKMPRYDEVKPYEEKDLKKLYKIIPVKDLNQISLEWILPYCDNYHVNPLRYLSHLIGDEDVNTLTSSLNKDNLCDGLLAGPSRVCKTYMTFYISINLSKKGLQNYKEVILRCLKYIKIMQSKELNKRYHDEYRTIENMNFQYRAKLDPITATKKYATYLMEYKPEDVIAGPCFNEYDEELIKKYLDMLQLDNLNIYFFSNIFEKECNLTEKYYGTKYSKEDINITEDEINSYKCDHVFDYPPENEFMPKNFDILPPPEKINKYPEKIKSNKNMEIWYLQDTIFKKPEAYLFAQFITPVNICDFSEIKIRIMASVLDKIITQQLGEFLYSAEKVNVNVNFSFGSPKSHIIFEGYNDSCKKGMISIFKLIKNLDINNDKCKEILELYQKTILRRTKNIYLNQSYRVNMQYSAGLMDEPFDNPEDIINFLNEKKISIEDLILYKNAIFKNSKMKWLIQGNITKEDVLEITEEANKIFEIDIEKEKIGKFLIRRPVYIRNNYNYIYRMKSPNPEEKSSSLISIYQFGFLNLKQFQYLKLLESFLSEKFYDQLRTKETLGYIVNLSVAQFYGNHCFLNIVQSNSKTPEYCASRVRNFYKESYQKVKDITDEEFKTLVDSRISLLSQKDDNLSEEFVRNWSELNNNTYIFDRVEKSIAHLKQCNKEELIQFYEKYCIKDVAILDSEFLCEQHYEENEKDLKETKILEGENIIKRIICDNLDDFKACNCLGFVDNNPLFMLNNDLVN